MMMRKNIMSIIIITKITLIEIRTQPPTSLKLSSAQTARSSPAHARHTSLLKKKKSTALKNRIQLQTARHRFKWFIKTNQNLRNSYKYHSERET